MEVILRRSPDAVFLLDVVDESAKQALHHVQNQNANSPPLVIIIKVHSPSIGDCGDAEHDADEDGWPSNKEL